MDDKSFSEITKPDRIRIQSELDQAFREIHNDYKTEIKKTMFDFLNEFVGSGGKRLRPIMFLKTYKGLGGKKDITRAALSVELFHNSTLIHDDIMDEDEKRRSSPSMHERWKAYFSQASGSSKDSGQVFVNKQVKLGATQAILGGNILLALAQRLLIQSDEEPQRVQHAMQRFVETYIDVNLGQSMDTYFEIKDSVKESDYMDMAYNKTGRLFQDSMIMAALLAGASAKTQKQLHSFAKDFSLAFQLHDDLLDIEENTDKGNTYASDMIEGKQTLLIIKAFELGSAHQQKNIRKVLTKDNVTPVELKSAVNAIKESGAYKYVKDMAKELSVKAKKKLQDIPFDSETKQFFSQLSDYVISRNR